MRPLSFPLDELNNNMRLARAHTNLGGGKIAVGEPLRGLELADDVTQLSCLGYTQAAHINKMASVEQAYRHLDHLDKLSRPAES